jgi:hypothetical protein
VKLSADAEIAGWMAARPAMEWDAGNSAKSETKHGESRYLLLGALLTVAARR